MSKIYEIVTEKFIKSLESGVNPWRMPYHVNANFQNPITKNKYKGINFWQCYFDKLTNNYKSNYWLTFNQIAGNNGYLKKGSKSIPIIFYSKKEKKEDNDQNDQVDANKNAHVNNWIVKYYNVFNVDNIVESDNFINNIKKLHETEFNNLENEIVVDAETVINNMHNKPAISINNISYPCYMPLIDEINIPSIEKFDSTSEYYSTFFHELIHSTGHETRLKRFSEKDFSLHNKDCRSKEELTACIGSNYLINHVNLNTPELEKNEIAYWQNWAKYLKTKRHEIISACSQAQKACDFIINQ